MLAPSNLHFQKLQLTDLVLLHQWLNTSYVQKWWNKEPTSFEAVQEEYKDYFAGSDPTLAYLIFYGNTPIGYIQTYKFEDEPKWSETVQPGDEAAGIDMFIGHEDYIHRGLGSFIIRKFLHEVVFAQTGIETCIIDPEPANQIAIRAYEKAGFVYWKTIYGGEDETSDKENYCMRITKTDFMAKYAENIS